MRKILFLTAVLWGSFSQAQVLHPATWKVSVSPSTPNAGEEVIISFDVKIDEKWYLYSNDFDPDLGPMLAEFVFEPHVGYELVGETLLSIRSVNMTLFGREK